MQSLVHGIPGGYGKGSVDGAREGGHVNSNSDNFKVGFDGGHGESGYGGRGQSGSFSSIDHGSTRNSHSDRIHFGGSKGSSGSDPGFSHTNLDLNHDSTILGSNQNGLKGGTAFHTGNSDRNTGRHESVFNDYESGVGGRGTSVGSSQHNGHGIGASFGANDGATNSHGRGVVTSPAGNGHSTGTVFLSGSLGHGNSDRNTGQHGGFNDYGSGVGGRGTSVGSSQHNGHGNGASFGTHDHSSEFGHVHSSGCGHGGHSHGFRFGSSSNVGEHAKGHKGEYQIFGSVHLHQ